MNHKTTTKLSASIYLVIATLAMSCNNKENITYTPENTIELQEPTDCNSSFFSKIDSVTVLDLQVNDEWMYMEYPMMCFTDNYMYFLNTEKLWLGIYDKKTNSIKYSNIILGRGRNECLNVTNLFSVDDSICLFDCATGSAKLYSPEGSYLRKLNGADVFASELYKIHDGYIGISEFGFGDDNRQYITLFDDAFSSKGRFFEIPELYFDWNIQAGHTIPRYVYNDTLRFVFPFSHCIYSFSTDGIRLSYDFHSSNPIPVNLLKRRDDANYFFNELSSKGYEQMYEELMETDKYLTFKYCVNNNHYRILLEKRNNQTHFLSSNYDSDHLDADGFWSMLLGRSCFLYSDNKYIYASLGADFCDIINDFMKEMPNKQIEELVNCLVAYKGKYSLDYDQAIFIKIKFK